MIYIQSDALLLADVFENFGNSCLEIQGLAWQAALKKTK